MKKWFARLLLVVALCPVVAQAVVFVPLGLGLALVGTTVVGLAIPLTISTAIVGAVVTFVAMSSPDPTASTVKEDAPLLVQINPADPLPTPTGWIAPVSPAVEPRAPNTATYVPPAGVTATTGQPWDCGTYTAQGRSLGGSTYSLGASMYKCLANPSAADDAAAGEGWSVGGTWNGWRAWSKAIPQCATGYTYSGGVCVSTAGAVGKPSDGKCTIKRTGNSFAIDPNDPDCAADNGTIGRPATTSVQPNIITADVSPTVKQKVELNATTGTTTISTITQNANNTTTTTTTNVSYGNGINTMKITGQGSQTVSGTGDLAGTTPLPTSEFPTDYNKEATQAQIKAGIDVMKDVTGLPATDAAAAKAAYDEKRAAHEAKIEEITANPLNNRGITFAFTPFLPSTTCFEPTLNFVGRSWTLTWCSKIELMKELLAWAFFILTGFGIYNMVVRDKE